MTDLTRLRVSLTKHGAHKVAELIKVFPTDQVLKNTWDSHNGIRIDKAQSWKNLSANQDDTLPVIWEEAKQLGGEYVDDLVMMAIILSHHELINVMIAGSTEKMSGTVNKADFNGNKAYTNFANNLEELGFTTAHNSQSVSYELFKIFKKFELVPLVIQLLTLKLKKARWAGTNDFLDECIALDFHKIFGVSEAEFREWLQEGGIGKLDIAEEPIEEEPVVNNPNFRSGHVEKSEADVLVNKAKKKLRSTLLHNKIQNKLYNYLKEISPPDTVGTEVDCGIGKPVDVVVNDGGYFIFYEIKTDNSVRMCIRQALPQLLEYSCWPNQNRAGQLIIVSQNPITNQGRQYIEHLKQTFGLPIYYQQFDLEEEELKNLY